MARSKAKTPTSSRELDLLAAIVATDDDGAFSVYGDWLLERDDLRGKLIGELLRAPARERKQAWPEYSDYDLGQFERRRETPLAQKIARRYLDDKKQRTKVLGPLEPVVKECVIDRGVLAEVVFYTKTKTRLTAKQLTAINADPRWATVRVMGAWIGDDGAFKLMKAPLFALRMLTRVDIAAFHALAKRVDAAAIPLEHIEVSKGEKKKLFVEMEAIPAEALPKLRSIKLDTWHEPPAVGFFRSPLVRRLVQLRSGDEQQGSSMHADAWVETLQRADCRVPVRCVGPEIDIDLDPAGKKWRMAVRIKRELRPDRDDDDAATLREFEAVRKSDISSCEVSFGNVPAETRERVGEALAHLR